ncbi:MAG: efflux RND transporter periplasmic adaptor subunit [Candidatus Eisenbacteria sp.]|nr:efflux RND transporter periplasmic adaptor subunit [Candidatus Eisenbacteria bacterium]
MKDRTLIAVMIVAVVLGVVGVVRLVRTGPAESPPVALEDHSAHDHDGHDEACAHDHEAGLEHGAGEGSADLDMTIEEILSAVCEHGLSAHLCDDCRYEVGVVRVDESLTAPERAEGKLVRVERAQEIRQPSMLQATGEVGLDENRAVHIRPRIPGIIHTMTVDIGDRVSRGDVLFEMESTELGRALGDYEKNRAMAGLTRRNYERERTLFERKISSEWDMIRAQMEYEEYQIALRAGESELRVLGLTAGEIEGLDPNAGGLRFGRLPLRAPIDGTIIEKHAAAGERVDPEDEVMLLADLGTVWVWANIYEPDLAALIEARRRGEIPVEVSVRAFPGHLFPGHIDYIGATMDERTRTVRVRATIANDEGLLRPGMFCDVRAMLGIPRAALAVPREAVLADGGRDFIFKHLEADLFMRRLVTAGRPLDDRVEILAGLEAGEQVVTHGAFLLKSDVLRSKMGAT